MTKFNVTNIVWDTEDDFDLPTEEDLDLPTEEVVECDDEEVRWVILLI